MRGKIQSLTIIVFLLAFNVNAQRLDDVPAEVDHPISPTPVRANGKAHLFYELHITNLKAASLKLLRLEVYDPVTKSLFGSYEDAELAGLLSRPGASADLNDKRVLGGGMRAVVFLQISFAPDGHIPNELCHRFLFTVGDTQKVLDNVMVRVAGGLPFVISPPLRGDRWLALSALSNTNSHRRTLVVVNGRARIAQRFATDWTRIGADGLAFRGDPSKNANWSAYGADVLAVAGAIVSDIKDGIPENDPTSDKKAIPIDLTTVAGNYIILNLGGGKYALYAHLQPGSIRVKPNDKVRAGQLIALLGNSGQSDAPHLHFHIMDSNSPLGAEGLPYAFKSFELMGVLPSKRLLVSGGWKPTGPESRHRMEIPFENSVVRLP